jgi:hypothetical protein
MDVIPIDPTVEVPRPPVTKPTKAAPWFRRIVADPQRARLETDLETCEFRHAVRSHGLSAAGAATAVQITRALGQARSCLMSKRTDAGFGYLHIADELEIGLLSPVELGGRVDRLRREAASGKVRGWRVEHIVELLNRADAPDVAVGDRIQLVADAVRCQNHAASNEYLKITILRRAQTILIMIGSVLFAVALWLALANTDQFGRVDAGWVLAAAADLGALGGVTSVLQRATRDYSGRVPQLLGTYVVSLSRALVGGAAGLLAYLAQRVIIETDGAAKVGGILAAAFVAGFAERLLPENPTSGPASAGQADAR